MSTFRGDPDMRELIGLFAEEMPERIDLMRSCWERQAWVDLRRAAHQLKGASGGYGFPDVGQAAARLESALSDTTLAKGQAALEGLKNDLDGLIDLCLRVKDGGTRELLEGILVESEEHVDWLETQLGLIQQVGLANYLQSQMGHAAEEA